MTDTDYIKLYRETQDVSYVGQLYKLYSRLVFGVCMKYLKSTTDAEDASMDIFEICLKSLKKSEPTHFKSWLFTVTKNHCLFLLRKKQKELDKQQKLPLEFVDFGESDTLIEERLQLIDDCLAVLEENQRKALVLHYHNQFSYNEVSQKMGWSANQTKSYIQNGKRNLRLLIEKKSNYA